MTPSVAGERWCETTCSPPGAFYLGVCTGTTYTASYNLNCFLLGQQQPTGTPVFVGGSKPTTYAGYRLAAGSPGKGAASDGTDMGILVG